MDKTAQWYYHRSQVSGEPIVHAAGTPPKRPLDVGDHVLFDSGHSAKIHAITPSLLLLEGHSGPMHRGPIEGDHSKSIWSSDSIDEAGKDVPQMNDEQKAFMDSNDKGPTRYSSMSPRSDQFNLHTATMRKTAHDSGDGETIYHCPFCGSGQVIARSDRSVECEFCHTCFTVQVQPQFPAFPQTINGQPVQVPGMPGQIQSGAPVGGDPAGGDPGFPVDPDDVDDQGGVPGQDPQADDGQGGGDDDSAEGQESKEGNAPPWAKKSLRTSTGAVLPVEEYANHLAIVNAQDRRTMAEIIRAGR